MTRYDHVQAELRAQPRTWLITGVGGFIGSNLLEALLRLGQTVTGLDNFATGRRENLADVEARVGAEAWRRFQFIEGDIARLADCQRACAQADYILHQAALGSVPRSLADPIASHAANVNGFLNMLVAARERPARRFVYASSSSVYGDHPQLPKVEDVIGKPLSPYAATKRVDELYADVFQKSYGLSAAGLRYFNVFGPRQDPAGAYAAVIPRWFDALASGRIVQINGDGETSRDFCFIANVVQANLLAATAAPQPQTEIYNVAFGGRTTLNELYLKIRALVAAQIPEVAGQAAQYQQERAGDVRHSHANIELARDRLGYAPKYSIDDGLAESARWYLRAMARSA